MEKVTEADFEKVRAYVAAMTDKSLPTEDTYFNKQRTYAEAKDAAVFLINYYYTEVEPDNGEKSIVAQGERPYDTTKTYRAINAFNNGPYAGGSHGDIFIERHPDLLEKAIVHYEAALQKRLKSILKKQLSTITGEQLLVILQEHERRKEEGFPLTLPEKKDSDKKGD